MSASALQLVNRVLRWARLDDVPAWPAGGPQTSESLLALDLVNDSWREVLEGSRPWDFDIQNNGVLVTQGLASGTTGGTSIVTGPNVTIANYPTAPIPPTFGNYFTKLVFTSDSNFNGTSFNVPSCSVSPTNTLTAVLDQPWPGDVAVGTASWMVFANEYVLPPNVRQVLSMRHQQTPIQLRQIEKHQRFDGMIPRPWNFTGFFPWLGIIGNLTTPTIQTGAAPAVPGIGILLFPTPSISYRLDYDFVVRRSVLVNAADTLSNVPDSVVDVVIEKAFSRACYSNMINDAQLGAAVDARAEVRLRKLRDAMRPSPLRHTPARSLDDANVGIRRDWGRIPPITGSLI